MKERAAEKSFAVLRNMDVTSGELTQGVGLWLSFVQASVTDYFCALWDAVEAGSSIGLSNLVELKLGTLLS